MRVWAQSSQRSTWPPSAAVRQVSIADITRSWARLTCPTLSLRQASPWRRKISATSSFGRLMTGELRWRWLGDLQSFKRAFDLSDRIGRDPSIASRGVNMPMPEQVLNHPNIDALLQEVGGKTVPQSMDRDRLIQPCGVSGEAARALQRAHRNRPMRIGARKQEKHWSRALPIGAENDEQFLGQHVITVHAAH